jgi:hypothetical protein
VTSGSPTGTDPTWRAGRAVVPTQSATSVYLVRAAPPPPKSRAGLIAFVLLTALFAMCCIGGATLAYVVHTSGASSALGPALPGLNTAVQDGKFEFVVASVNCGRDSVSRGFIKRPAQGQFCLVALSVRNIGTRSQTFFDAFQKATTPGGDVYAADSAAGALANTDGANLWALINPGNKVNGMIVFDIPATRSITSIELHDTPVSHGVTVQLT